MRGSGRGEYYKPEKRGEFGLTKGKIRNVPRHEKTDPAFMRFFVAFDAFNAGRLRRHAGKYPNGPSFAACQRLACYANLNPSASGFNQPANADGILVDYTIVDL